MSTDPIAEAALAEAESIINAESAALHNVHDLIEEKVTQLQRIACIPHQDAHKAYALFFKSMHASAKLAGVSIETFMSKQSDDRIKVWMGMIIGSMPDTEVLLFQFKPGYFDDEPAAP